MLQPENGRKEPKSARGAIPSTSCALTAFRSVPTIAAMEPVKSGRKILLPALLLGLWCPLVLGAAEAPLQARFEGTPLAAWPLAQGARVELDGQVITLNLEQGALLSSLRGAPNGFLLAGSSLSSETTTTMKGKRRLFVAAGDVQATFALPALAHTDAAIRCQPVLLTESGRLVGIAWLEGETMDRLAVKAARWQGRSWSRVERVAGLAPGSQLALTGTVLADGSWLLAWSRFDGQDDEIVWSHRIQGEWSTAKNVSEDNTVPDIVPALQADGTGALLAWSRYDGKDYRLQTTRFSGGEWTGERIVGPPGSWFPSFLGESAAKGASDASLLYRTAQPRGWAVATLSSTGELLRQASLKTPGSARPVAALSEDGAGVRFRWPDRKKAEQWIPWKTAAPESAASSAPGREGRQ